MRRTSLVIHGLRFHWRSHVAVALGVTATTATLTGALLVGDSMRASLRDSALNRLGTIQHALVSNRFFRQALADEIAAESTFASRFDAISPALFLRGGARHGESLARVNGVNILGVEQSFWALEQADRSVAVDMPVERAVILNEPLANELGAHVGSDVLLTIGRPSAISTETLLGRRDHTSTTLRLSVASIVAADGLGAFTLRPSQSLPRNAWVPLEVLQRALDRRDRINAILIGGAEAAGDSSAGDSAWLNARLRVSLQLDDLGLRIRIDHNRNYLSIESESLLIPPVLESVIVESAKEVGVAADPMLAYLANRIEIDRKKQAPTESGGNEGSGPAVIPYSTVTALPRSVFGFEKGVSLEPGRIMLNRWAADDLNAAIGDTIRLTYYMTGDAGTLESLESRLVLGGIFGMNQAVADPGFTPEYKGITDTQNLADWDPPFPVDLNLIRDKDEAYWDRYRAAPKAFLSLEDGRKLWTDRHARFGASTAIRLRVPMGSVPAALAGDMEAALLNAIDPEQVDLTFDAVRRRIVTASKGTTDFGMLFVGFSIFLIVAAVMLAALFFRLGVEQRTREIGTQLAVGFTSRQVARRLVAEGCFVSVFGGTIGLVAAWAYTWLMLAGLRTWWAAAANAPFLEVHVSAMSLLIGFGISVFLAIVTISWSIRGLTRRPARALLAGESQSPMFQHQQRGRRRPLILAAGCLVAALSIVLLPEWSGSASRAGAFFAAGAVSLIACLALIHQFLRAPAGGGITSSAGWALVRFGVRNASRHAGRSMLTVGLIASATFVVTALAAFRLDAEPDSSKYSGTGGFPLIAETAINLPFDLNTADGRESLGIAETARMSLEDVHAVPFRLRPGDEIGCVNLYAPNRPRILGATEAMVKRGGFAFKATLAQTPEERENPWLLLMKELSDGAIPVIADEAAVLWQLHLGLGQDLEIDDERGNTVHLRFVALLSGSVLQDEIIVAESSFIRLFPSMEGYGFFCLEVPSGEPSAIGNMLERELAAYSFDVTATDQRIAGYQAVQNTYLSTFQTLGGLGLVLGTVGLAAVLLRNVWERRSELALMRAVGFSRGALATTVLSENIALVVFGLLAGIIPAIFAVVPHMVSRPGALPWASIGVTLVATFVVGVGGGAIALVPTLNAPLLPALRRE